MLEPLRHILSSQRIILASASPRRRHILENIGLKFEVIPSSYVENLDKTKYTKPWEYAIDTAAHKAKEVYERVKNETPPPDLVIGSDTIVTLDGKIYEKPRDKEDAFQMLSPFSKRTHTVYTGVVLLLRETREVHITRFHEATDVQMANLSPDIITRYVNTGEPLDKAGGYGIQEIGGTLVESIHGDYFNVMGFPLHHFCRQVVELYRTRTQGS